MMNGYLLGPILILVGAVLSYYASMLLVQCATYTGKRDYESIAMVLYGPRMALLTAALKLICLVGVTFSYIVFVKSAIPEIIELYFQDRELPEIMRSTDEGKMFWGVVYSFFILFPMSIPRKASVLRFSSLMGVLCSVYLSLAVAVVFFTDREVVP